MPQLAPVSEMIGSMKVFRRAAGAGEPAQPGKQGLGSLSRQIAAAAVAIVAIAVVFVVMAIARYNDARTRADLDQKVTALTLMVVNAAPYAALPDDVAGFADPVVVNQHEAMELADSGVVPGSLLVTFGAAGCTWDAEQYPGTPVAEAQVVEGGGLAGMRQRAEALGGSLSAQPTADGFVVEGWLPFRPGGAGA